MSEQTQTVYEALGAEIGIRKAVDEFYARVVADPELQPFFVDVDLTTLRRHQVDMLSAATGGPRQYQRAGDGRCACGQSNHRRCVRPRGRPPRCDPGVVGCGQGNR